jgi:DNA polymerase-3 subunit delta
MKLAANRIDGFVRAPDPEVRVALVYGPDSGLVRERAEALVRSAAGDAADPFRAVALTGGDIARDPARLADEFTALSMIGGRRAVRVREAADAVAPAVAAVLDGPGSDCLVVLEAGELTPRSALRKLCEDSGAAVALPCYLPDAAAMGRLVRDALSEAGLSIDRDAETLLAETLAGDRQLARRELDKLIAYMGSDRRVGLEQVMACIGDSAQQSLGDLALAVADGDAAAADRMLVRLAAEGTGAIGALRAVQRHFTRLHLAGLIVDGGESPDRAMARLKPPVFFKEQGRFRDQLRRWPPPWAARALARLADAERDCKRTGVPQDAVCGRVLFDLCRAGRARRAGR